MCEQKSIAEIISEMGDEDAPYKGPIIFMTAEEREINLANLRAQQSPRAVA